MLLINCGYFCQATQQLDYTQYLSVFISLNVTFQSVVEIE